MYFFDGNMNIEQHDKCHKCSLVKNLECPIFEIVANFEIVESDSVPFGENCTFFKERERKLRVVK